MYTYFYPSWNIKRSSVSYNCKGCENSRHVYLHFTITIDLGGIQSYPDKSVSGIMMNRMSETILCQNDTVYPKNYAHGFCFAVLCCGYTLTDFPISIRLTSLALWQSNDCPSASKATLMNMDIYFMWIHYERLHKHNKVKHNKTVCIFLGIYCNSTNCLRFSVHTLYILLFCIYLPAII